MNTDNIKDKGAFDVFNEYFAHINDPRQAHKIDHLLSEILFITILAIIAGADDFNEIARYARWKKDWLATFLKLPGGIPSHDTFNRVLCLIDAKEFQQSFVDWVDDIRSNIKPPDSQRESLEGKDIISIDGKTACNSKDSATGKKAIHMVSALSSKYGLVLGQQKCYEKSNEITAIPRLLDMFLIEGPVITLDAMGCQRDIASKIIRGKADFINKAVRKHWFVENKLHWILDVIFKEDYSRVRTGNGAENLNTIRKIALNTIKMDTT